MARNRKKSKENKKAGFRIEAKAEYRNKEGYADPTAYEAIRKTEKKEKAT